MAAEVPAEKETLRNKPDAEPAIEELSPIEESAAPADGEALATDETIAQEDIVQTPPAAVEQVGTPTEAETVPAPEEEVATPKVEEVAPTTDA